MLKVENLCVSIHDKPILKNISLHIQTGEIHAIMGRNGSGKSTLAKVIAGHPLYQVDSGDILFLNSNQEYESLLTLEPEERVHKGIFIGFQLPVEISGLNNENFLRTIYNTHRRSMKKKSKSPEVFREIVLEKMQILGIDKKFLSREVNRGFSGGEKKKNEILQMSLLNPKLAFLDEVDSGLDVDGLSQITQDLKQIHSSGNSFVLITHYHRLLHHIQPHFIHIMKEGEIILSSNKAALSQEIEEKGFEFLFEEKKI